MKITRVSHNGIGHWARLEDNSVAVTDAAGPDSVSAATVLATLRVPDAAFLPPIGAESKVLCVGLNYRDHLEEMGREVPNWPVLFTRFPDSLVGHGEPLVRPTESDAFDYEGELAIVIGQGGRRIASADALRHVLGYTVMNDGSVRDYQRHTIQFTPGKNFERSGALGPAIVTPDEVGDLDGLTISTRLNGELVQQSTLDQLIFTVPRLIEYISSWTPLRPGDVIATGTPGGVGDAREPKLWMSTGDVCEVSVELIGVLRNTVVVG